MPKGIIAGMFTLIVSAFAILYLNPSVAGVGSYALGRSGEPLLDGFRAIFGGGLAKLLALIAVVGLIASFHTIIFAYGRQIYSLSRAGYFPTMLSVTHGHRKTPHVAMIAGAVTGLAVMFAVWFGVGAERGSAIIGGTLLNMAVFGAMFSYIMQGAAFVLLRRRRPEMERPYRSPLGETGALTTIAIAAITIYFQLLDPIYRAGVVGVAIWFVVAILYFALYARNRMVRSPEEEFAISGRHIEDQI
jgi:ethanolamine permease